MDSTNHPTLENVMALAERILNKSKASMRDSSEGCLQDAVSAYNKGNYEGAWYWTIKSIAYNLGICHPTYIMAVEACNHWKNNK